MSIATKHQALSIIGLAAAVGLSIVGCQSDELTGPDQVTAIEPGQISVSSNPAEINAPWFLVQPDETVVEGSGSALLEEMPSGQYKLVWAPVAGWYSPTPNPLQRALVSGGEISFSASYTEIQIETGSIAVDTEPDELNASWTLTGPSGFVFEDSGDEVLLSREPGVYTLTFDAVPNYETASQVQGTLVAGSRLDLRGSYIFQAPPTAGTIIIDVTPDRINAPWTVTGPGVSEQGNGDASLAEIPVGDYTITFGEREGWISPVPSEINRTLTDGELEVVFVTYTELPGPNPDAPKIDNAKGPFSNGGPVTISGVDFGQHTLDLSSAVGPDGWIESNSPGTGLNSVSGASGWDVGQSSVSSVISSERSHSGNNALLGRVVRSDGFWQSVMRYEHPSNFDKIYVSFWMYFDPIAYSTNLEYTQWKWWRVDDNGGVGNDCSEIYMPTRWTNDVPNMAQLNIYCKEDCTWPAPCDCYEPIYDLYHDESLCSCSGRYLSYCNGESYERLLPTPRQWCRVEIFADSSDMDVANGRVRMTIQKPGQAKQVIVDWEGVPTHKSDCCSDASDPWQYFMLQNYWDDDGRGSTNQRADFFYDDIYLQFGTQARVEIGNAASYAACTQLEAQTPTSWIPDGTSIDVMWNFGAFSSGEMVYLYITREDGSVNQQGYPVTLQ